MRTAIPLLIIGCALLFSACIQPATGATGRPNLPVSTSLPAPTAPPLPVILPTTPVATEVAQTTPTPAQQAEGEDPPTPVTEDKSAVDTGLLDLGKAVYRQQACGVCHTLASVGTLGTFGPAQDNLAVNAAQRIHEERYKGAATTAEAYIRESIVNPQAFMVTGYQITRFPMPIFTNLSEREVDALVYLLMQPSAAAVP